MQRPRMPDLIAKYHIKYINYEIYAIMCACSRGAGTGHVSLNNRVVLLTTPCLERFYVNILASKQGLNWKTW